MNSWVPQIRSPSVTIRGGLWSLDVDRLVLRIVGMQTHVFEHVFTAMAGRRPRLDPCDDQPMRGRYALKTPSRELAKSLGAVNLTGGTVSESYTPASRPSRIPWSCSGALRRIWTARFRPRHIGCRSHPPLPWMTRSGGSIPWWIWASPTFISRRCYRRIQVPRTATMLSIRRGSTSHVAAKERRGV
jgi:hypothetical protein